MTKRIRKVGKRTPIANPVRPRAMDRERFQKSLDYVISRYRKLFTKLA